MIIRNNASNLICFIYPIFCLKIVRKERHSMMLHAEVGSNDKLFQIHSCINRFSGKKVHI